MLRQMCSCHWQRFAAYSSCSTTPSSQCKTKYELWQELCRNSRCKWKLRFVSIDPVALNCSRRKRSSIQTKPWKSLGTFACRRAWICALDLPYGGSFPVANTLAHDWMNKLTRESGWSREMCWQRMWRSLTMTDTISDSRWLNCRVRRRGWVPENAILWESWWRSLSENKLSPEWFCSHENDSIARQSRCTNSDRIGKTGKNNF